MSDEINDLIAEANAVSTNDVVANPRRYRNLLGRLADALEAATRERVQGEPNDDREALARVLYIARDDFALPDRMAKAWDAPGPHGRQRWYRYADAVLAAGFSRAPVPDAATELRAERDAALARIAELETMLENYTREYPIECNKRVKAEARIAEAAKLHQREPGTKVDWCSHCIDNDGPWPCPTAVSLGLNEGENGVS